MSKTEKEKKRITDEFDQIQSSENDFDVSTSLADSDLLPDLGEMSLYDYDSDIEQVSEKSEEVLESLVDLYLDDVPKLKEHPYIKNKMAEDATVYSEALFLAKMTRKNFLYQLKQVDNGDNSARMHEVVNQTIGQIRENSKFLSNQRTELEKFYKNLRDDLGYDEIAAQKPQTSNDEEEDDDSVVDNRKLNDLIKDAMKNEKKEKGKKKKK